MLRHESLNNKTLSKSLLKQNRIHLLQLYGNPGNGVENVQKCFDQYMSLLVGFVSDLSDKSSSDSKLRYTIKSKWTLSLYPNQTLYTINSIH